MPDLGGGGKGPVVEGAAGGRWGRGTLGGPAERTAVMAPSLLATATALLLHSTLTTPLSRLLLLHYRGGDCGPREEERRGQVTRAGSGLVVAFVFPCWRGICESGRCPQGGPQGLAGQMPPGFLLGSLTCPSPTCPHATLCACSSSVRLITGLGGARFSVSAHHCTPAGHHSAQQVSRTESGLDLDPAGLTSQPGTQPPGQAPGAAQVQRGRSLGAFLGEVWSDCRPGPEAGEGVREAASKEGGHFYHRGTFFMAGLQFSSLSGLSKCAQLGGPDSQTQALVRASAHFQEWGWDSFRPVGSRCLCV